MGDHSNVDCVGVVFAGWMGLEVGITGVNVEEPLLPAPPGGAIAPTAGLLLDTVADCMVVEVGIGGVTVVALMLVTPPRSAADEDRAGLGITRESRKDVEPGMLTVFKLVVGIELSIPGAVYDDVNRRVVVDA